LRFIHRPIKDSNGWRIRYNYELYALYEDIDITAFTKVGRLTLAGEVMLFEWTSNGLRKEFLMPSQKTEKKEEGLN
jgi:hypothetical protein